METRIINNFEQQVSRICLGTMTFGSQVEESAAERIVGMAEDAGVNFIDTANVYNGGESERMLGQLLNRSRSRFVLASKVGMKVGTEAGLSSGAVMRAVESSLTRLRTDYLDICYLHLPDYNVAIEETLSVVDCLVRQGKVRKVGTSNFAAWQLCRMLHVASVRGAPIADVTQPMYNLLARRIEDEFLPACRDLGITVIVYNPLAGGLLTGKHQPRRAVPGSRFDGNQAYIDRYWSDLNFEAVRKLQELASAEQRSMVSLALNWLLHHTPIDAVIVGVSNEHQLCENLKAIHDGPLTKQSVELCDQTWAMLRGPSPKYNR